MAEYIKREKVWRKVNRAKNIEEALNIIDSLPTADVAEVKHGEWIETDYKTFDGFETESIPNEGLKCSLCNHVFRKKLLWCGNYCPNCGAKMDLRAGADNDR